MAKRGRPRTKAPLQSAPQTVETSTGTHSRTGTIEAGNEPSVANQKVVSVEQQMYGDPELSTSAMLFPEEFNELSETEKPVEGETSSTGDESQSEPEQLQEQPIEEPAEEAKAEPAAEPQAQPELSDEEIFDLDQIGKRKVKTVIDGEERVVPISEVIKNYQTDQHLGRVGNKIGEMRRQLAEEKRQLETYRQQLSAQPARTKEPDYDEAQTSDPRYDKLQREIEQMRQEREVMMSAIQPTLYESARAKVDNDLKSQGFDDFMTFIPKIDAYVAGVKDENMFNYYNTPEGAKSIYFQMKAQEAVKPAPKPEAPKQNFERPKPPVVKIDGGTPASQGKVDDTSSQIRAAMERARKNPKDPTAWNNILELKGY